MNWSVSVSLWLGPKAIFIKCTSGRGWLPITDPSGTRNLFKHIGPVEEVDLSQYELNDGSQKVGQAMSYALGGSERTVATP